MVIVTVKSKTKSEYSEQYLKEFNEIAKEVRKENGCLEYELYQCGADKSEFFLFERWESKNHVEIHLKTKHMIEFLGRTENWFESKDVKIYELK
jgi:quinol monooxygenase YgiN